MYFFGLGERGYVFGIDFSEGGREVLCFYVEREIDFIMNIKENILFVFKRVLFIFGVG